MARWGAWCYLTMNKQSFLEAFFFFSLPSHPLIWAFIVCYTTCRFKLCNCLTLPWLNEILTLRARAHSGALNREECVFVWFFSLTHWERSIITAHKLWKARHKLRLCALDGIVCTVNLCWCNSSKKSVTWGPKGCRLESQIRLADGQGTKARDCIVFILTHLKRVRYCMCVRKYIWEHPNFLIMIILQAFCFHVANVVFPQRALNPKQSED